MSNFLDLSLRRKQSGTGDSPVIGLTLNDGSREMYTGVSVLTSEGKLKATDPLFVGSVSFYSLLKQKQFINEPYYEVESN